MTTTILLKSGSKQQESNEMAKRMFMALGSSVRVPVTAANREYLRAARQAELAAWRNAPGGTLCGKKG